MRKQEMILRGISVSAGFVLGRAFLYRPQGPAVSEREIEAGAVENEVKRFYRAVRAAEQELRMLHSRVKREMGADFAEFIAVQLALVADPDAIHDTEQFIREKRRNAEFAFAQVFNRAAAAVADSKAVLMRERALDIADVAGRVLRHLLGKAVSSLLDVEPGTILVARDLPPSEAALLDPRRVVGLVLEAGGKTSHTAIMAKAKELPAVVGVGQIGERIGDGDSVFVDGFRGLVIVNPSSNRLRAYDEEIDRRAAHVADLSKLDELEPVTLNNRTIDLSANIEFLAEARVAKQHGARGIGLYRTEYMYLARRRAPTEDEQYAAYAEVARLFRPHPVLIRTFDLGGDKVLPGYTESNPFLGFRAIRLMFENPDFFGAQIRAILRASAHGNVKMMLPMVATIEEVRRARLLIERAKRELRAQGRAFNENFEYGIMVEIPSAAIMADRLAQECNFLSIGSNDLTQYTLAVDRGNERVARLFDHFHPAVLQLIKQTIDAAHRRGIWVGLCGEFASDPLGIILLIGLGIDELSTSPGALPEAKNIIRSIDTDVAAEVAALAMKQSTALEVQRLLRRELDKRFPQLASSLFASTNERR